MRSAGKPVPWGLEQCYGFSGFVQPCGVELASRLRFGCAESLVGKGTVLRCDVGCGPL